MRWHRDPAAFGDRLRWWSHRWNAYAHVYVSDGAWYFEKHNGQYTRYVPHKAVQRSGTSRSLWRAQARCLWLALTT